MNHFIESPATKNSVMLRRPVHGVGVNDSTYIVRPKINGKYVTCPYYRSWVNMLNRCYNDQYQEKFPTYIGCSVVVEWLTFSKFREWMESKDWQGKSLDKDILINGNKIYGPDTCIFVSCSINGMLCDRAADRGDHPQGVYFSKRFKKYQAQCSIDSKKKHLGCFDTVAEAEIAYLTFKSKHVSEVALKQVEPLKSALLRHSDEFLRLAGEK